MSYGNHWNMSVLSFRRFNESLGRSTSKYGDPNDDFVPPINDESDVESLLKQIEDRIKNNVEIKEQRIKNLSLT